MAKNYPDCMPFGKYKGIPIEDVPSHYLYWFINNIDPDNGALESIINKCDEEYNWREETDNHFEDEQEDSWLA